MARMEIMSHTERRRRRRWSNEAKLRILAGADQHGVRIGDVARRHDIYPPQIRLWRQSFNYVGRPAMFIPVEMSIPKAWLMQTLEHLANGWPSSEIYTLIP